MNKYLQVIKITLKEQFAYKFNVAVGALVSIFKIILAYLLWKIIFADKTTVGDFTFSMMMTYYILISFFAKIDQTESLVFQFSSEIRNGQFTNYVVRPINPICYYISMSFAKSAFVFLINSVAFVFWIIIFRNYFILPDLTNIVWVVFFVFTGLYIMIQTTYMVSMLSFKILDVIGIFYGFLSIIQFLSGALIPLSILPDGIENIIRLTPYYYTLYFPASLYLGLNGNLIVSGAIIVTFWCIAFTLINGMLYNKLFKYYEGVGA